MPSTGIADAEPPSARREDAAIAAKEPEPSKATTDGRPPVICCGNTPPAANWYPPKCPGAPFTSSSTGRPCVYDGGIGSTAMKKEPGPVPEATALPLPSRIQVSRAPRTSHAQEAPVSILTVREP